MSEDELSSNALINTIKAYEELEGHKNTLISFNKHSHYRILKELKSDCKNYIHMHMITKYYDEDGNPEVNNWTDIEGEYYGWIWNSAPEDKIGLRLKKLMYEHIKLEKRMIRELYYQEPIIKVIIKNSTIYHFIHRRSFQRDDIFEFSNEELDW